MTRRKNSTKGFARAISLLESRISEAGARRGFSMARLLTHWPDVVGADLAALCAPVKIGYGKGGIGATLTLLSKGATAPMLEMQKEALRAKVNACYGYNAIARIHITQTSATGFAEGQAAFAPAPRRAGPPAPDARARAEAAALAVGAKDDALRASLEALAANFLTQNRSEGSTP